MIKNSSIYTILSKISKCIIEKSISTEVFYLINMKKLILNANDAQVIYVPFFLSFLCINVIISFNNSYFMALCY